MKAVLLNTNSRLIKTSHLHVCLISFPPEALSRLTEVRLLSPCLADVCVHFKHFAHNKLNRDRSEASEQVCRVRNTTPLLG